jgi:hypothetical protein
MYALQHVSRIIAVVTLLSTVLMEQPVVLLLLPANTGIDTTQE